MKRALGILTSALLIVSICSMPLVAEALVSGNQNRRAAGVSRLSASAQAGGVRAASKGTISARSVSALRKSSAASAASAEPAGKAAAAVRAGTGGFNRTGRAANGSGLCLVVLGLQLNPDGSMQPELIGRLETLVTAAKKNPQAIIVCTGGHTAMNNRAVSEAGQMADWLRKHGIDSGRILVESKAITTQDNAVYTLELLGRSHPEISKIAIITSDYHMNDGVELFASQAGRMGSRITVTAGSAWSTR